MRATRTGAVALATAAWLALAIAPARAQAPQVRVTLKPVETHLGEPVIYRVEVIGGFWKEPPRWMPPDSGAAFTWGEARHGLNKGHPSNRPRFGTDARTPKVEGPTPDTAWVEIPLQVFELGIVPVPGLQFRYWPVTSSSQPEPSEGRAPTARVLVVPLLTAADSSARLRPLHGPLAAPWWERVPWLWVTVALVLIALAALAIRAWRRRRRIAPRVVPAAIPLSPAAAALAALAELRALELPRQGRFAEHAFRLGQILRRYLESMVVTTQPGDSSPELVRHLRDGGRPGEEVQHLEGLLRVWDRVKFAREPFTADEAGRAESAVEDYVRATATPASEAA